MTLPHAKRIIFFDTEFTDLVKTPKLISIGLVDETGQHTFYAELSDTYEIDECSEWVQEHVLPLLEGGETLMPRFQLRKRLRDWLDSFGEPVALATDSAAWDWPWIQGLFSEDWPPNLDARPYLLNMNYLMDISIFDEAVERAFAGGLRRHHALDDAKANRLGWIAADGDYDSKIARGRFTV